MMSCTIFGFNACSGLIKSSKYKVYCNGFLTYLLDKMICQNHFKFFSEIAKIHFFKVEHHFCAVLYNSNDVK